MTTPRLLTSAELADLPTRWENALVDTSKYYPVVMSALEVNEPTYRQAKADGRLCQEYKGRYYVAA